MCGEGDRLSVMAAYGLDRLTEDDELQRTVEFAARLCDAPIALASLVEEERQRFIARSGLEVDETPRSCSLCADAMLGTATMVIPDTHADPRFADNLLVTGDPHIRFYAGAPLVSVEGAPLGALCVIDIKPRPEGLTLLQQEGLELLARSVMQRLQTRRQDLYAMGAIRQREQELRHMLDSVPGIAWSARADGLFDMFNARWGEITGAMPPATVEGWEPFVHPDDWPTLRKHWKGAFEGNLLHAEEWRMRQADGSYRWVLARAVPVMDEGETVPRWFGTTVDIDDNHRLSEARDLLANELSHRIKNIFAVVASLITMRARNEGEAVQSFASDITDTIRALGTAHDYVRPIDTRSNDSLKEMLRELLAPYQDSSGERIVVEGDSVAIGSRAATPLALIFHELATNAAKYGAFDKPGGRAIVRIGTEGEAPEQWLCLSWIEQVPDFVPPQGEPKPGFGSRLIQMAVTSQLRGTFAREYLADGLRMDMRVPVDALTE